MSEVWGTKPGDEVQLHMIYTIKSGDTLSKVAQRHGLTNADAIVSKLAALLRAVTTRAATDQ